MTTASRRSSTVSQTLNINIKTRKQPPNLNIVTERDRVLGNKNQETILLRHYGKEEREQVPRRETIPA